MDQHASSLDGWMDDCEQACDCMEFMLNVEEI